MTAYNRIIISALLVCPLLLSCQRETLEDGRLSDSRIDLRVAVPGVSSLSTKASGQTDYKGIINSTTEIDEGLVMGVLRTDQTLADFESESRSVESLDYKGVTIADASFNPKDYTFSNGHPYYYCSKANLNGNPGVRFVDFDVLQYFKNDQNFGPDQDVVHYYGWYPYGTPVASSTDTFKVNFNLDGKTDVLYSSIATQRQKVRTDTLKMHHALCQYRIWVYRMAEIGEEGTSKAAGHWGRINQIVCHNQRSVATFTVPSKLSYSSPANFDLSSLPNATLVDGVISGASNGLFYVTKERKAGVEKAGMEIPLGLANRSKIACFLAPPPEGENLTVSIHTDASEGAESTNIKNLSVAGNFQPGKAYDIILCFSDHGVIIPMTSMVEWTVFGSEVDVDVEAKMYYDLSRYGTANSYMVSSANVGYCFLANVKGCGNENGGGSIVGVEDCSLPEDSHVDLLYESTPGLIHLDAQSFINGKVIFWVPGQADSSLALANKGNAIIAARKEKNGEILWSWHIWVTDRPLDQGYLNGYDAMDRDLGALSGPRTLSQIKKADNTSYGLLYQWGRKDPMIPGYTKWSDEALANESDCIAAGIQRPDLMYSNWNVDNLTSIMGFREAQENIKTIYDPCPPGYRMPEIEAFSLLDNFKEEVSGLPIKGGVFTGDTYNYFFYPDCGFISAKAGGHTAGAQVTRTGANDSYGEIYHYTSDPANYMDGASGNAIKTAALPDGSQASGIDYRTNRAAGAFPVRCISTGSKTKVTDLCEAQTSNCYIVPEYGAYKFRVDIKGNGVNRVNLGGSMWNICEDQDINIDISNINHVAVLWWQGDVSGRKSNNSAGTDCPIKFVNSGRTLPRTPAHNLADFGDSDITVPDEDGYVQFYISENNWGRGNALVAAFDASNNIIWSWHLWLTETPGVVNLGPWTSTADSYTYEYTMMDRNLGATYHPTASEFSNKALTGDTDAKTVASVGLYYQWGRKDPIQGPDAFATTYLSGSTSTNTKPWYRRAVSGNYSWETRTSVDVQEAVESMHASEKNPSVFYKNTSWTTSIFIWQIQADRALYEKNWFAYKFGCSNSILKKLFDEEHVQVERHEINKFKGRWGFNTQSYTTEKLNPAMTKTMYDPCPPGYFMPASCLLTAGAITDAAYGSNEVNKYSSSSFVWSAEKSWTAGSETHGLFANKGSSYSASSRTFVCDDNIWIPFGGYRDFENGQFNTSKIPSGTPSAVWLTGQDFLSEEYEFYAGVRSLVVTASGSGQIRGMRPADAGNVRCRAY